MVGRANNVKFGPECKHNRSDRHRFLSGLTEKVDDTVPWYTCLVLTVAVQFTDRSIYESQMVSSYI